MKVAIPFLGLVALSSANIIFTHVKLSCDPDSELDHKGCLRGQVCNDSNE
jgi:hypothetical protein